MFITYNNLTITPMSKMKEFLTVIGRKDAPSMDEIAGDELMTNAYYEIFGPYTPSEANKRSLAREVALERWRAAGRREARERANK